MMLSLLLSVTLVDALWLVHLVNDNPVDTPIDRIVLNSAKGESKRNYR